MGYQKGLKPLNIRWICAWPERDRVYVYGRGLDGNLLSLTPFFLINIQEHQWNNLLQPYQEVLSKNGHLPSKVSLTRSFEVLRC